MPWSAIYSTDVWELLIGSCFLWLSAIVVLPKLLFPWIILFCWCIYFMLSLVIIPVLSRLLLLRSVPYLICSRRINGAVLQFVCYVCWRLRCVKDMCDLMGAMWETWKLLKIACFTNIWKNDLMKRNSFETVCIKCRIFVQIFANQVIWKNVHLLSHGTPGATYGFPALHTDMSLNLPARTFPFSKTNGLIFFID